MQGTVLELSHHLLIEGSLFQPRCRSSHLWLQGYQTHPSSLHLFSSVSKKTSWRRRASVQVEHSQAASDAAACCAVMHLTLPSLQLLR